MQEVLATYGRSSSDVVRLAGLKHSFTFAVFCKVSLNLAVNETNDTSHNHQVIGKGSGRQLFC